MSNFNHKRLIGRFIEIFTSDKTRNSSNNRKIETIDEFLRFQIGTSKIHGGRRYLPNVFTESGIAMLSAVLKSDIAVKVSIRIMEAFVAMRKFINQNAEVFYQISSVEKKTD